jgi:anti-anti-sigma factor
MVVELVGCVDLYRAPEVRNALQELILVQRASKIIVNMAGVDYIDAAGKGTLVQAFVKAREVNCRLLLCGLRGGTRAEFERSNLHSVLEICASEEQALQS